MLQGMQFILIIAGCSYRQDKIKKETQNFGTISCNLKFYILTGLLHFKTHYMQEHNKTLSLNS